jgi:hypothetical protein
MEAIFSVRQLMERYKDQKKDLRMVFIDFEKGYDKILQNVMWWAVGSTKSQQSTLPSSRTCTITL